MLTHCSVIEPVRDVAVQRVFDGINIHGNVNEVELVMGVVLMVEVMEPDSWLHKEKILTGRFLRLSSNSSSLRPSFSATRPSTDAVPIRKPARVHLDTVAAVLTPISPRVRELRALVVPDRIAHLRIWSNQVA